MIASQILDVLGQQFKGGTAQTLSSGAQRFILHSPDNEVAQAKQGITPDVIEAITAVGSTVSKSRKKRQISSSLAGIPQVASLQLEATYPLHKTTQVHLFHVVHWTVTPLLRFRSPRPFQTQ